MVDQTGLMSKDHNPFHWVNWLQLLLLITFI